MAYLSAGNRIETVCNLVNISPQSFYEWVARGEGRDPDRPQTKLYADFAEGVKTAMGYAESSRLQRIEKAGKGGDVVSVKRFFDKEGKLVSEETTYARPQWQADAWYLERMNPDAWGRRVAIDAKLQGMSNEEIAKFILDGVVVGQGEIETEQEDEDLE